MTTGTTATTTVVVEAATTSAPEESGGRPERAAAALSEGLYARHHRMVLGLCRGLLRDASEAEDAAQQTFLSAHRALLNGAEPRQPAAWLATIARNECWARTSARMREPLPSGEIDDVAATNDPVQEAIRRADLRALWLAIEQLPRQQRDALLLREFGGLRYDELAVALAVSGPSVESLLFRARARLRTQLKAVYATVTGGAWLEPLARLLASGGAPALATKAVALGLGAAAVTGSAVVGPDVLQHHHPPSQPRRVVHVVHHTAAVRPTTAEAATITPAVQPTPIVRRVVEHKREHSTPAVPHERETEHTTPRTETRGSRDGETEREPTPTNAQTATVPVSVTSEQESEHSGSGDDSSHSGREAGSGGGDDVSSVPTTPLVDDQSGHGSDDSGH